jgi:hypothetical protein
MSLIVEGIRPKSPTATKTRSPQPDSRKRDEPTVDDPPAPPQDGVGTLVDKSV